MHHHRSDRPTLAALAVLLLALGLLIAAQPAPAYAADNGRWSVFPTVRKGESDAPGARRAHFRMTAKPGSTVRDKVTVSNLAKEPVTFLVYAADAYNTPRDGGFAVREATERQRSVGAWTRLQRSEVTIAAGGRATIPFTLTVPGSASPGDHPGAIIALDKRVARAEGTGVGIRQAVGARVYLQVSGERAPALRVENVRFDYDVPLLPGLGEDATISYTLVNRGNVLLEPRVDLVAKGLFGRTSFTDAGHELPAELMPGQRVQVTQRWAAPPPLDWGSIELIASDKGGELVESETARYRTVNWTVLSLLALVLVTLLTSLVIRRRKVRNRATVVGRTPRP